MQSLAQVTADISLRGRVVALYMLVFRAGPAVSAACIGFAAQWIGLQHLIGICAVPCAVIIVSLWLRSRPIFASASPASIPAE